MLKEQVRPQTFRCLNASPDHVCSMPNISKSFIRLLGLAYQHEYGLLQV